MDAKYGWPRGASAARRGRRFGARARPLRRRRPFSESSVRLFCTLSPTLLPASRALTSTEAQSAPGIVGVLTAKDMQGTGSLGRHPPLSGRGGKGLVVPHRPALAAERVVHIGEPVVMIVAESAARRAGRGRTCCDRIRGAHAGDRRARSACSRRATSLAGSARQPGPRLARTGTRSRGQCAGRRRHLFRCEIRRADRADESADGGRFDGAARRDRELRCHRRPLHATRLLAGHQRHARPGRCRSCSCRRSVCAF